MRMLETRELFRLIGPNLDPARSLNDTMTIGFVLTDLEEEHRYGVRRGVGRYYGIGGPDPDARVRLSRGTLELILANRLSWTKAIADGDAVVIGPIDQFEAFLSFFDGWREA